MPAPISVVIPLYNHEKYIASSAFSVFSQTNLPVEIIVIDDGSLDGGGAIVRQMQKSHSELIFWRQDNRGAHNTINSGIARATGEFIAILNSDDIFEPDRLEIALETFRGNPKIDAVATGISFINDDGNNVANPWHDQALSFYKECGDLDLSLVNANFFMTTSNLIVRRNVFDEIGVFSNLRYTHDLDFLLRLIVEGRFIQFIEAPLLRYRLHSSNTISEGAFKVKEEWAAVTAFHLSRLVRKHGIGELVRFLPVLRRHTLLEAVTVLLPYFLVHPSQTFERNSFHSESNNRKIIRDILS